MDTLQNVCLKEIAKSIVYLNNDGFEELTNILPADLVKQIISAIDVADMERRVIPHFDTDFEDDPFLQIVRGGTFP